MDQSGGQLNVDAALFDFDGTLTERDSFRALLLQGFRRQPWRLVAAATGFPIFAAGVCVGFDKRYAKSWLLWCLTVGLGQRRAFQALEAWGSGLGRNPQIWKQDVIDRYLAHRNAGHDLVICTASAAEWVAPMMQAAGLKFDHMVATKLSYRWGGVVVDGPNCYGTEKPRRLERWMRGRDSVRFQAAYSDHPSDVPLLNLAETAWIVGSDPKFIARFEKGLGVPFAVVGAALPD